MSSQADRLASCDGKTPYPTYAAAQKTAKRMRHVRIYRCRHCRSWHVGNTRRWDLRNG